MMPMWHLGTAAGPHRRTTSSCESSARRSPRTAVVSGPPSPGLSACITRMREDLAAVTPETTGAGGEYVTTLRIVPDGLRVYSPLSRRHGR